MLEFRGEIPLYYEYFVQPKINFARFLADENEPIPIKATYETVLLKRHIIDFEAVKHRYPESGKIDRTKSAKIEKSLEKKEVLKGKLEYFERNPSNEAERLVIQRRLKELSKTMQKLRSEVAKCVSLDYVKLFLRNLDYMFGGFCTPHPHRNYWFYVFVQYPKDIDQWLQVAQFFTDYGQEINQESFPASERPCEGKNITLIGVENRSRYERKRQKQDVKGPVKCLPK